MKLGLYRLIFIMLPIIFIVQLTKTSVLTCFDKSPLEITLEEFNDEEPEKDTDNEEDDDRNIVNFHIYSYSELTTYIHHTFYHLSGIELVQEIVPPPPKA